MHKETIYKNILKVLQLLTEEQKTLMRLLHAVSVEDFKKSEKSETTNSEPAQVIPWTRVRHYRKRGEREAKVHEEKIIGSDIKSINDKIEALSTYLKCFEFESKGESDDADAAKPVLPNPRSPSERTGGDDDLSTLHEARKVLP